MEKESGKVGGLDKALSLVSQKASSSPRYPVIKILGLKLGRLFRWAQSNHINPEMQRAFSSGIRNAAAEVRNVKHGRPVCHLGRREGMWQPLGTETSLQTASEEGPQSYSCKELNLANKQAGELILLQVPARNSALQRHGIV